MRLWKGKCCCETDCIRTKGTGKENLMWKKGSGGVKRYLANCCYNIFDLCNPFLNFNKAVLVLWLI